MNRFPIKRALALLLLLPGVLMASGERYALVIGNSRYEHLTALDNPSRDASAMARALGALGFLLVDTEGRVMSRPRPMLDLDVTRFTYAVQAFADRVRNAEIAFIYYAGHGMQIGGRPQLLPVDSPLPDLERDRRLSMLSRFSLPLDEILEYLDGKAELTVAVFDACREIPNLEQELRASSRSTGAVSQYRGLGRVDSAGRSRIIAYSGGFGQLVADGPGADHSPYTAMLLQHLDDPGISVGQVFQTVAFELGKKFGGQNPEVLVQGVQPDRFYLAGRNQGAPDRPPVPVSPAPILPPEPSYPQVDKSAEIELAFWQSADRCGTTECLREYLSEYPSGSFSSLARARLKSLAAASKPPPVERLYARTRRLNPRGDNFLSMRSGPGGAYREIARIYSNGTEVEVLGRSGKWRKVRYGGEIGWSHSAYLTEPSAR